LPIHQRALRLPAGLVFVTAALLSGCAPQGPPAPTARVYAIDMQGAARRCVVPPSVTLAPGQVTTATMEVGNDGGWCAISVALQGQPYASGLLTTEPNYGHVYIHPVGDNTRIDYTPTPGFVGADSFAVTLLPGRPVLRVNVTVTR
jgi:hypothetical protein